MHRSKLGLLALCIAALSVMAFAANSASAAEWLILTKAGAVKTAKELKASIVAELEPKTDGTLLTHLLGLSIGVLCTAATLEGASLEGGGKVSSGGKVVFTGCTVVEEPKGTALANCTVSNPGGTAGTVASKEGKGQLQTNGETLIESNTTVEEAGKKVGVFAELKFAGTECPLTSLGTTPVKGVFWIKDCELNAKKESRIVEHLEKHLIVESTAHGHTLWLGANNAEHLETSVDGSALALLANSEVEKKLIEHAGLAWGATLP